METIPYDHAVRRIYEGRITKDELLEGMKVPFQKHAHQIENRIKFILMNRNKNNSVIKNTLLSFDERIPSLICNEVNLFKEYKEYFHQINRYFGGSLGQDSFEWAKNLVDKFPDTAAHICSLQGMNYHYSIAFHNIVFPPEAIAGKKKSDKYDERFFLRVYRKLASSAKKLADDGVDPFGSDAITSICNIFFGGTRTLMIMLLGSHYRSTYIYLSSIILGMYASDFSSQRKETLLDHKDVRELMRSTCPFIDILGEDSFLAIEVSGDLANMVARQHAWKQHHYSLCAQDINKLIIFERNKNKDLKDEVSALKAIQAQADILQKIEDNNLRETSEASRLRTENEQLRMDLKKASETLFLREQKITLLTDKIAEFKPIEVIPEKLETKEVSSTTNAAPYAYTLEENKQKLKFIRGLVIGGHANFVAKIRRLLPGWKFHSVDDTLVDDGSIIDADIVVLFTKYASHKITEKPMRICRQRNIPIIYANHTNPSTFLNNIAVHLEKFPVSTKEIRSEIY
jgi:hypothetical protein